METTLAPSDGTRKGKRLQPRFVTLADLALEGRSVGEIAEVMERKQSWVRTALRNEDVQLYIRSRFEEFDQRFENLNSLVIDAIRDGLQDDDIGIRLKAAFGWLQQTGKYDKRSRDVANISLEDVVSRLIEQHRQLNINIQHNVVMNGEGERNDGNNRTSREADSERFSARLLEGPAVG